VTDKDVRFAVSAEDRFSRVFQNLKRDIAGVGENVGRLNDVVAVGARAISALSLGTVAGVSGLGLALKSLANDLDALNDASDAIGDSIENLSAIENVARRNGESLDLVVTAATKLNKALSEAKADTPIAQALKAIGLNAEELRSLPTTEALQRIAVALQGYTNNQQRAAIVTEIFGKSSRQVSSFLNDLAAAGQLNATVTAQQALEAEKFNKQLAALATEAGNAGRAVANELLPAINSYFEVVRRSSGGGNTFIAELVSEVNSARLTFAVNRIQDLAREVQLNPGNAGLVAALKSAREEYDALQRAAARANETLKATLPAVNTGPTRPPNEGGGNLRSRQLPNLVDTTSSSARARTPTVIRPAVRVELPPEVEALQAALRRLEQTDVAKLDRLQAELSALFELQRESRGSPAVARAVQQLNEELDALNARNLPATAIDDPREQQRTDFLRSEREAYGQVEEYIKNLADSGTKDLDKLSLTIDRFAENTIDALLSIGDGSDFSAKRLFDSFRRDLLREFIEDPVRDSMRNVVKSIKDELGKLEGDNNPIAALLKLLSGAGSSIGSAISGFFGGGSELTSGFTSRTLGGGVRAGELVRWKENGREWFVPGENGTVLTQAQMQGQGGSYSPSYTFNIQGGDPREVARQVRAMLDERDARNERSRRFGKLRGGA
jgi:hypothetical protein